MWEWWSQTVLVHICVCREDGNMLEQDMMPESIISDLKVAIADVWDIPVLYQVLTCGIEVLADTCPLQDLQRFQLTVSVTSIRNALEAGNCHAKLEALKALGKASKPNDKSITIAVLACLDPYPGHDSNGEDPGSWWQLRRAALKVVTQVATKGDKLVTEKLIALVQEPHDLQLAMQAAQLFEVLVEKDSKPAIAELISINKFHTFQWSFSLREIQTGSRKPSLGDYLNIAAVRALGAVAERGNQLASDALMSYLDVDLNTADQFVLQTSIERVIERGNQRAVDAALAHFKSKVGTPSLHMLMEIGDKGNPKIIIALASALGSYESPGNYICLGNPGDSFVAQLVKAFFLLASPGDRNATAAVLPILTHGSEDAIFASLSIIKIIALHGDQLATDAVNTVAQSESCRGYIRCYASQVIAEVLRNASITERINSLPNPHRFSLEGLSDELFNPTLSPPGYKSTETARSIAQRFRSCLICGCS